ncbi:MAG: TonB-dependent siderophore receptor, partial [Gammaproteobacteria bacterium]
MSGDFTREEGLAALLAGTGLEWAPGPGGTYVVQSTALAQATPDAPVPAGEQPVELDPIIVTAQPLEQGFKANMQETATKTPLSIRETPQSVSVITQDSLKARQTQDLGQALETAAGVFQFSGTGPFAGKTAFGFDQITVRGIVLDGYFSVLEDGFISPTFFSKPDLAIYERVEVVKGPSSTLYGRGSPGGLVNRVRKKPLPEFRAEVSASVGSFDTYRLDVDITGPLFASESAGGRMVVAYEDAGAFVDGVESERILAAPSLALDLTDSTRLLLQGTYQEDSFIPNPGFPLVFDNGKFRAPDIRRSLFVGTPNDDENEWELLTGTAQLEQALGDNWPATLKFNRSSQDSQIDLDSYAYGISPTGDVGLYSSAY